jgi:MOSC domain-containing protein YiiM
MGENLTTQGIDVPRIRIGDQIRAGGALLEITQPRGPCSALDIYGESLRLEVYDQKVKQRDYTSARWGRSGFYASVAAPGPVRMGDAVSLVSQLA